MDAYQDKRTAGGFTLIEALVALALILGALVGPVTLVTMGLLNFSFAHNKLIAANLAQEGVELIRTIRDNNILCDEINGSDSWLWDHDPGEASNVRIGNSRQIASPASIVSDTCGSGAIESPDLENYSGQRIRYDSPSELYGYIGSEETIFARWIDISSPPSPPTPGIPPLDQMDVISTVTWTERGRPHSIVLQERMYNWK